MLVSPNYSHYDIIYCNNILITHLSKGESETIYVNVHEKPNGCGYNINAMFLPFAQRINYSYRPGSFKVGIPITY